MSEKNSEKVPAARVRRENTVIILFSLGLQFVLSVFQSLKLLMLAAIGRDPGPIPPNHLLESMNFALRTGPAKFWRRPTAIKMGRSIATFIRYVFYREKSFREDSVPESRSPR
ncbi:MAG TPA: hypothetical protein PK765_02105 [bacterium]|nr:hypothetical protein [bacterium]